MSNILKNLDGLHSVALVGASERSVFTRNVLRNMELVGYSGQVLPVNPRHNEVLGYKCYESISSLPDGTEWAIILTRADSVPGVVEECSLHGIKNVVILSSGFAETISGKGREAQERLRQYAIEQGMQICGPNSLGLVSVVDNAALFSGATPRLLPGSLGIVSQSGQFGGIIASAAADRGMGVSFLISSGNEAVLQSADYLDYLVEDPRTEVICLVIEGCRDGERLRIALRKAALAGKPVIALKLGTSAIGRRSVATHTGQLAGTDSVYDALFRETAVLRVATLDQMVETSALFAKGKRPTGRRIAAVTVSGGAATLTADLGERFQLSFPPFSDALVRDLTAMVPDYVEIKNPMDAPGAIFLDQDIWSGFCRRIIADEEVDVFLLVLHLPEEHQLFDNAVKSAVTVASEMGKPFAVIGTASSASASRWRDLARVSDIPFLQDVERGLKAVSDLIEYRDRRHLLLDREASGIRAVAAGSLPERNSSQGNSSPRLLRFRALPESTDAANPDARFRALTEWESSRLLADSGIKVVEGSLAHTVSEAKAIARRIGGPVALKVVSRQIQHKTEAEAVRLNVRTAREIEKAYREIIENARSANPRGSIDGVLVQQMVLGGIETIVGIADDPQFGHVLVLGLGGIFVETLGSFTAGLMPLNRASALQLIDDMPSRSVLYANRGSGSRDIEALIDLLVQVSAFAERLGSSLVGLDLNPVMVLERGRGVVVVDSLVVLEGESHEDI